MVPWILKHDETEVVSARFILVAQEYVWWEYQLIHLLQTYTGANMLKQPINEHIPLPGIYLAPLMSSARMESMGEIERSLIFRFNWKLKSTKTVKYRTYQRIEEAIFHHQICS